jgi:hypothetical protein
MTWTEWFKANASGIAAVIIFVIVLAGLAILLNGVLRQFNGNYSLSGLALSAILVLLGALLLFTTLINAIGLSARNQALGLPEGSVRALLALALLGLFAVLVASVLNPSPERRTFTGLREGDVTALIKNNPGARDIVQKQLTDSPATFQVDFYSAPQQDEFAKQMLTLVGTLMTSVIAFYFGTSAVKEATDAGARPSTGVATPQVRNSAGGSTATANTATNFTISGIGLAGVTQVEAVGPAGAAVQATNLTVANDRQVTCTFTLAAGKWTVRVRSGALPPVAASPEIDVT